MIIQKMFFGRLFIKACFLLVIQKVIHFYWRYFCKKKCIVWNMQYENGYRIEKVSCPIIFLREGKETMPVELYFSFKGMVKTTI